MTKSNKLIDQRQALDSFFESLMRDVEAYVDTESNDAAAAVPAVVEPAAPPVPATGEVAHLHRSESPARPVLVKPVETRLFAPLPPVAPAPVEAEPPASPAITLPVEERVTAQSDEQTLVQAAPDPVWLGQELQAMLFKVAGLTLAVPLVDLHGVVEWDEAKVTAMPGHADFYLGLLSHLKRNIPIVDTARLVLPEDRLAQLAGEDPRARISRVVLINDSRYGLACDEVNEVITLKVDDVRWRSERTRRRWLAGTVIKHMCALIDATAFAALLAERAPVTAFRE